jgi:23S rRNA (adenine2503-C2)-methyltransferase
MDLALVEQTVTARGEPPYRARQVWEWAARGAGSYEAMTNLPSAVRRELADAVPFSTLTLEEEVRAGDGT